MPEASTVACVGGQSLDLLTRRSSSSSNPRSKRKSSARVAGELLRRGSMQKSEKGGWHGRLLKIPCPIVGDSLAYVGAAARVVKARSSVANRGAEQDSHATGAASQRCGGCPRGSAGSRRKTSAGAAGEFFCTGRATALVTSGCGSHQVG
jgi:hypothetical protein